MSLVTFESTDSLDAIRTQLKSYVDYAIYTPGEKFSLLTSAVTTQVVFDTKLNGQFISADPTLLVDAYKAAASLICNVHSETMRTIRACIDDYMARGAVLELAVNHFIDTAFIASPTGQLVLTIRVNIERTK